MSLKQFRLKHVLRKGLTQALNAALSLWSLTTGFFPARSGLDGETCCLRRGKQQKEVPIKKLIPAPISGIQIRTNKAPEDEALPFFSSNGLNKNERSSGFSLQVEWSPVTR